jgi:GTP:adenosylcobinamide-phosphate guanylyltransferase
MKFIAIIPARYASTRFPGKPLALLGGKTVIQRVYEQASAILDEAYVATDDERIYQAVEAFGGKRSFNGISLPDTPFYHYCIQQNLYRYMLEAHYGIKVKDMNLVVLCADYPTYIVANVPKMDKVIKQIIAVCHEKDLGHQLLSD